MCNATDMSGNSGSATWRIGRVTGEKYVYYTMYNVASCSTILTEVIMYGDVHVDCTTVWYTDKPYKGNYFVVDTMQEYFSIIITIATKRFHRLNF